MMITRTGVLHSLTPEQRDRLMALGREVSIPAGTRIFEEGSRADRFWLVHTGSVALDLRVPGRRSPVVATLGSGDLLGWSWLFPPRQWRFGAEAVSRVHAYEFEVASVLELCEREPALGRDLAVAVAAVVGERLTTARTRLLELYGPYDTGPRP